MALPRSPSFKNENSRQPGKQKLCFRLEILKELDILCTEIRARGKGSSLAFGFLKNMLQNMQYCSVFSIIKPFQSWCLKGMKHSPGHNLSFFFPSKFVLGLTKQSSPELLSNLEREICDFSHQCGNLNGCGKLCMPQRTKFTGRMR